MDSMTRVSVVISMLNAERFLEETIESVFSQTFKSWELLLVDDGSTDGSPEIAQRYVEKYPQTVRYLEHHKHRNRGLPASRNFGIRNAVGEYIALLDADDVWLPSKLERQVEILDAYPEAALIYGSPLYWHSWTAAASEPDSRALHGIPSDRIYAVPELLKLTLSNQAVSPCPSDMMFRKVDIVNLGGFEESFIGIFSMYEDQSFLMKVYAEFPVYVSSEYWDRYRVHPEQLCATVVRAGQKTQSEYFFLSWTQQYLSKGGQMDSELQSIMTRRLWPHNHPFRVRVRRFGDRVTTRLKRAFVSRER